MIDDLNVCADENYLPVAEVGQKKSQAWRVYQLINGYIRHLRERKPVLALVLHESSPAYGLTEDELDRILAELSDLTIQRFNDSLHANGN